MRNPITEIRHFANQLERFFETYAKAYDVEGLGGPQGHVILYLTRNEDEAVSIKTIEDELKISKSVASNLVKRMEKNGFIEVIPSRQDKRSKLLHLTDLGQAKAVRYEKFIDTVHVQIFKNIDMDQMRQAFQVFEQLGQNISKDSSLGENDEKLTNQEEGLDA